MNTKRLVLTIIVVFIVANFTGYFIHAIWLKPDYMLVANLYRPAGQEKMVFIVLAYLSFAIGSVFVYAKGVENRPWLGQGVRFGIALCLILTVPSFFIAYAVQPVPALLMAKQVIFEGIDKILLGVIIAALYRP
jgi:glucan phosphoethanolaminetransferase (alkaline phosphatase superfamily)